MTAHAASGRAGHPFAGLAYGLAPLAMVLIGVVLFPAAGRDDAEIACWPAHTLATRGEMLNYNDERVEQGSSLLWIVDIAALERITGVDTITLVRTGSIAAGVLLVVLCQMLAYRLSGRRAAHWAGIFMASSAYATYWAFAGLETALYALLLTASAQLAGAYLERSSALGWYAVVAGACAATRPEAGFTLIAALAAGIGLHALRDANGPTAALRRDLTRCLALLGVTLLAVGLLVAFRELYFHALVPQPVMAKRGGSYLDALRSGRGYVKNALRNPGQALALGGFAALGTWLAVVRRDARVHMLLGAAAAQLAFAVASGGDWMEAGRFLVPLMPAGAVLAAVALCVCVSAPRVRGTLAGGLVLLQVLGIVWLVRNQSTSAPLFARIAIRTDAHAQAPSFFELHNRVSLKELAMIERLDAVIESIHARTHVPVVVLTGQMGMIPFHITSRHPGHARWVDRFGLADRALTSCPVLRTYGHIPSGLEFAFRDFFLHASELAAQCGIPRPDVLYDVSLATRECPADYLPLYQQRGTIASDSRALPGIYVGADVFICVRQDAWLAPAGAIEDVKWPVPAAIAQLPLKRRAAGS